MTDLLAIWLGQFIGVLLVPAIMLAFSRTKPNKTWLRVIAGLWAFGGGIYPAINGSVGMNLGAIAAGVVGVAWAFMQERKAAKLPPPIIP